MPHNAAEIEMPKRPRKIWTPAELAAFPAIWDGAGSAASVAHHFGASVASVQQLASKFRRAAPPFRFDLKRFKAGAPVKMPVNPAGGVS